MTENERLTVYDAQCDNVRTLQKVRHQLNRSINLALRKSDHTSADVHTKCLALVFCAWVEANFSKLIHTPHGFALNEIEQIKTDSGRARSVESAWQEAIDLGLLRIQTSPKSNYVPNRRQEILRLVQTHVVEPSLVRNKIAHGQWQVALNRDNTNVNSDATNQIQRLDVVQLTRWFETQRYLANIVEALIQSPDRAFHRDYWVHVTELKQYLDKTSTWSLQTKIATVARKPAREQ